jgi:hypothetical protein
MGSVYLKHIAPVEIFFTKQHFEGIWYTDNEIHIHKNCRRLRIDLEGIEECETSFDLKQFNHFFVYTAINKGKYGQYVFSTSALKRHVKQVTTGFPYIAIQWLFGKGHFPKETFAEMQQRRYNNLSEDEKNENDLFFL